MIERGVEVATNPEEPAEEPASPEEPYELRRGADPQALLMEAAENPEEDLPRLLYADYQEEQGLPHTVGQAEFIRLQVERARADAEEPLFHVTVSQVCSNHKSKAE
jgi:uncharacterized protein (TIGR02996 family)